ncbi:SMI1/KNR4 family protein [Niallia sp. Man26]|uniref:SMI1/KNR4 family protein n=1 Tax=Niallia TaxID=2837506 RepID=UPI001EDA87AC|nr:SMI1/KNR4 family protein [Niallia sp. Man26]UPO90158.1 SMI1/KNR4 family protein [Niallia sp. Man26]
MRNKTISNLKYYAEVGNGISTEKIEMLENILDVRLPKSYKEFLNNFGYAELFGQTVFGYEPPDETTIIVHTEEWLERGLEKGYVVISDSHEFIYCLNTNETNDQLECPVVCYHPYESFFRVDYSSFNDYLDVIIEDGIDNID